MKRFNLVRASLFALFVFAFATEGQFLHYSQAKDSPKASVEKIAKSVTIYRDKWGVPHLYGPTDYSVMFGFMYAQAEDNCWQIEDSDIQAIGCHPMGHVRIVKGSSENIKITDSVDLVLADELFRIRQQQLAPNLNGLDLKGKHSVVFGGSAGIGKAIVQILEEAGSTVHSVSRRTGCDIADHDQVEDTFERLMKEWGRIDHVVNAAGLLIKSALEQQSPADVAQQVSVNLLGSLTVAQCAHAPLKEAQGMLLEFSSPSL